MSWCTVSFFERVPRPEERVRRRSCARTLLSVVCLIYGSSANGNLSVTLLKVTVLRKKTAVIIFWHSLPNVSAGNSSEKEGIEKDGAWGLRSMSHFQSLVILILAPFYLKTREKMNICTCLLLSLIGKMTPLFCSLRKTTFQEGFIEGSMRLKGKAFA